MAKYISEITQNVLSNHKGTNLEINNMCNGKISKCLELTSALDQRRREIKKYIELNESENRIYEYLWGTIKQY